MPWSGTGTFTRGYSWVADAAAALNISSSRMDADTNDIVGNGLNNCLTRDGQGIPTADLPMNAKKHTGVADATSRSNYPSVAQLQDNKLIFAAAGGTADALTATFTPATAALVDGEQHYVRAASTNATTTPTYAPDGQTAHTITKAGGAALVAGDIRANAELILRYNLANTRWELLNPTTTLSNRFTSFAGFTPTGSASNSFLMQGLGATCKLTPITTGKVRLRIVGSVSNNTNNGAANIQASYGTGVAPVNGAAATGTTPLAQQISAFFPSGNVYNPFTIEFEATGLTLATQYWFDLQLARSGGIGTASFIISSVIIEEIG